MLARSGKNGRPPQSYRGHVTHSTRLAVERAQQMLRYYCGSRGAELEEAVRRGSLYSDLGKLSEPNQRCLAGTSQQRLPLIHTDAGTQALFRAGEREAAILANSHHGRLPNVREELRYGFRAPTSYSIPDSIGYEEQRRWADTCDDTDKRLAEYLQLHLQELGDAAGPAPTAAAQSAFSGLLRRLGLACVVDGDRADAANPGGELPPPAANCRWDERLSALDQHVAGLSAGSESRRALRREVYDCCRKGPLPPSLATCAGACGTGKTTAGMASGLRLAIAHQLRHIVVVLPRISIIQQSVDTYRKILTLPGERPEDVVGEYHHEVELRRVGDCWNQPIILTTSVQFFETVLAASATRLRKLQQLPGSVVFIDESHAALPPENWALAWDTMKELATDWSCYFLLASGSLSCPWELERIVGKPCVLPDILPLEVRQTAERLENRRVSCRFAGDRPWTYEDLLRETAVAPGPRLVVLNTVQSAALVALRLRRAGREVLHLSTALTPGDRKRVIEKVKAKLQTDNQDWYLVATSCVEAGMDFDFGSGFHELAGAMSLPQLKGRTNRNDNRQGAEIVVFRLAIGEGLIGNPGLEVAAKICREMFADDWFNGSRTQMELSTEALRREAEYYQKEQLQAARLQERREDYPTVEELSRVIKEQTCLVIVDLALQERLRRGEWVSAVDVMRGSVQMWGGKPKHLQLTPVDFGSTRSYYWDRNYDPEFLGYMAGLLPEIEGFAGV